LPRWIGIGLLLAYSGAASFVLQALLGSSGHLRPGITILFLAIFIIGWFWILGVMMDRSATTGFLLLRGWLAVYGGMVIIVAPIVFVPHPITIIFGIACAVAWFTWLSDGKPHLMPPLSWVIRKSRD